MQPGCASEYADRGVQAVTSVLVELGQVLGAWRDRFVVIGGAVPWLLLPAGSPPHVGTLDVDLALDPEALESPEYATFVAALEHSVAHVVQGRMPDGRQNSVELLIATIPALLVMKGHALVGRDKPKDAYDAYYAVRNFDGGPEALAAACSPLLDSPTARRGFGHIASKFTTREDFGPVTVRRFLTGSGALGGMTPEQVQMDAYEQVRRFLELLGVR